MNTNLIVLTIAAACGLAAQTRLTADIPFAFDFQGQKLAAGSYEITRTSLPTAITLRHKATGTTVRAMATGTDPKRGAGNSLIFEKTGESYFFLSAVYESMATAYKVPATRKQVESARKQESVPVYVAAR